MRKPYLALIGGSIFAALVFAAGVYFSRPRIALAPGPPARSPALPAFTERQKIATIATSKPAEAKREYQAFVQANRANCDPKVQDEVGKARVGIAYIDAGQRDFKSARAELLEAAADYRGTGEMDPDFGGVKDEAEYQAAVCLLAEGRQEEGRSALVSFLKSEGESPLAKAAYRRLVRLDGGKSDPAYEGLLQKDVSAQQKRARYEMATCGPRALAYLLPLLGKAHHSYQELATRCGTTDKGTSLEQMRECLKSFGIESFGYELNREDFLRLPTPAIILNQGHFVVLTSLTSDWMQFYDPFAASAVLRTTRTPDGSEPNFTVTVLSLKPIPLSLSDDEQSDAQPKEAPLLGVAAVRATQADVAMKQRQLNKEKAAIAKKGSAAPQGISSASPRGVGSATGRSQKPHRLLSSETQHIKTQGIKTQDIAPNSHA